MVPGIHTPMFLKYIAYMVPGIDLLPSSPRTSHLSLPPLLSGGSQAASQELLWELRRALCEKSPGLSGRFERSGLA